MENLHELAGLIPAGKNQEGEQLYLGTKKQWEAFENLEEGEGRLADHDCKGEDGCEVCVRTREIVEP